jgi:hypothetical protein
MVSLMLSTLRSAWKDKHHRYTKKLEKCAEIKSQVFPIVLEQCHPALRERLQVDDTWANIDKNNDII